VNVASNQCRSGWRSELQNLRTTIGGLGHRLFVAPRSAWPLAFARIVIGIAILGWATSMWFDVADLLGENAIVGPEFTSGINRWIAFDTETSVRLALAVLVASSIGIIVGWRPTIWLGVAFVLLVAIQRRNVLIVNSGDVILRNITLLLAFTPTGAALSVDRMRKHGRDAFFTSAQIAPWGMRLVQLQMMVVYIFAFWSKSGDLWRDGTAVSTALRLTDLQRIGELDLLVENIYVVAFLTWSTLMLELALGTLLWAKPLRPVLIVLGVTLHLMIGSLILVGFFGLAMIAGLMTFLDADRLDVRFARRAAGRADAETTGCQATEPEAAAANVS
jgi:hypothetical protein